MKYYVVSDVHGYYTELIKALTEKGFFDDKEPHKLIVCGDMMDRGREAQAMEKFMLELLERDELIFIRGNHEDLMIQMLEDIEESYDNGYTYVKRHHVSNGTLDTAAQLTGHSPTEIMRNTPEFLSEVRSTAFVSVLIPTSVNYFETMSYIFVHGWIPAIEGEWRKETYSFDPGWRSASKEDWKKARWHNGMKLAEECGVKEPGKTIVCGHWHTSYGHSKYSKKCAEFMSDAIFEPYYSDGIIAIDACTAHSGIVNCILIEE